jgi:hypothetical protein
MIVLESVVQCEREQRASLNRVMIHKHMLLFKTSFEGPYLGLSTRRGHHHKILTGSPRDPQPIDLVQTVLFCIISILPSRELEHEQDVRAIGGTDEKHRIDGGKFGAVGR